MRIWWKQFLPYLILLSFIGNLYFAVRIYQQDHLLNLYTWGNAGDRLWMDINFPRAGLVPGKDGRVPITMSEGLDEALHDLNGLRSLPGFEQRVSEEDLRTLEAFMRYAESAYQVALKEQGDHGTVSPESVQRLAKVREGLELAMRQNRTTNQLKMSRNPWNYAGWRAVWHDIATGLRAIDFVPLPQ